MTRDQRFWRLLSLVQDYYTTGERTAGAPPAVRFPRARPVSATAAAAVPVAGARVVSGWSPHQDAAAADVRPRFTPGAARRDAPAVAGAGSATPAPPAPPAASGPPAVGAAPAADRAAAGAGDSLARVAVEVAACRACRLCSGRTHTVPGEGAARPLVMVVGEAPGRDEDRSGRPFVGPAGRYLDRWLEAIELQRDTNCFIANVVKCRPPDNRDPLPDEYRACLPFLQRQISLLRPRALLSVGRIASQLLTGRDTALGELRGQVHVHEVPGLPDPVALVTTYHPSAVLRNSSLRRPVWDDLRLLQRLLAAATDPPPGGAGAESG